MSLEDVIPGRIVRGPKLPTDPANYSGPVTAVSGQSTNTSFEETQGYDFSLSAGGFPFAGGQVQGSFNATYVDSFNRKVTAVAPILGLVDRPSLGGPSRWRANLTLGWENATWSGSLSGRYVNSYPATNPTIEGGSINANYEVDTQITRNFSSGTDWRKGLTVTVGVINLLDRIPPFEFSYGYSRFADPRQRFVYCRISKKL
jgi:hypothetical protein